MSCSMRKVVLAAAVRGLGMQPAIPVLRVNPMTLPTATSPLRKRNMKPKNPGLRMPARVAALSVELPRKAGAPEGTPDAA